MAAVFAAPVAGILAALSETISALVDDDPPPTRPGVNAPGTRHAPAVFRMAASFGELQTEGV